MEINNILIEEYNKISKLLNYDFKDCKFLVTVANGLIGSFWLTKGDYLRLKNLELGYTFRQRELLTKLGVQSVRLYLAGTNLLTFTPLDDYDPEKLSTDSRNDVHPNTRTYSFGVNVKF